MALVPVWSTSTLTHRAGDEGAHHWLVVATSLRELRHNSLQDLPERRRRRCLRTSSTCL